MNIAIPWPQEVDSFVTAARRFVEFCEHGHDDNQSTDVRAESILNLSEVYVASLKLPDVPFREAPYPPARVDSEIILRNLKNLPFQYYYETMEPYDLEKDGSLAVGDLLDDFVDV